jgi:hypothetical protein
MRAGGASDTLTNRDMYSSVLISAFFVLLKNFIPELFYGLKNTVTVSLVVQFGNIILKHLEMIRDNIVDIAEKRHFVSPDYPDDFLYPVVISLSFHSISLFSYQTVFIITD